jgi:hypothetical protein
MSASDTYDRYVTLGIFFPEGQSGFMPILDQWSLPVWFPDPSEFFPKDVNPTYAIRNTVGACTVSSPSGSPVEIPASGWWLYFYGQYQYIEDPYFSGGIPDTSGGAQYPPEGMRDYEVLPPQWVIDGTDPNAPPVVDDPTGPGWEPQPDPGGGGMTPPDAPLVADGPDTPTESSQAAEAPVEGTTDTPPEELS